MPRSAWLVAGFLLALSAGPSAARCPGDLNGDGAVTIDEVIAMVNTALYGCPVPGPAASCPEDLNGDGMVTVDEILQAVGTALSGCPTPTATPVPSPPTATATETTTLVSDTPTVTATPTPEPGTPTATITETPAPQPSTPTATETTTATPSPTPTESSTPAPPACPYTFLDDTLGQGISCDYLGPFNADPDCPTDLEAMFAGGNGVVGVGIGTTPDIITFVATVTSATSATLVGYTIGSDTNVLPVGGTVELQQSGQVLVIAPDKSPFDLATVSGTSQCAFVQYTGVYVGLLDPQAAPAAPPRRQTRGVQLASFRLH
jgi:hypothetical protein